MDNNCILCGIFLEEKVLRRPGTLNLCPSHVFFQEAISNRTFSLNLLEQGR